MTRKPLITTLLAATLALAAQAQTASLTLAWNAANNPGGTAIDHYNLYQGIASHIYTNITSAGLNLSLTASPLVIGTTYYFAVTGVTTNGLESPFSNELKYTATAPGNATLNFAATTATVSANDWDVNIGNGAYVMGFYGGWSADPYYMTDGAFGNGSDNQIISVNIPGWVSSVSGSVTVQCSDTQAWTNLVRCLYYPNGAGRVITCPGCSVVTVASNGLNTVTWTNVTAGPTNALMQFQLWAQPSTNAAARYFLGPMSLQFQ